MSNICKFCSDSFGYKFTEGFNKDAKCATCGRFVLCKKVKFVEKEDKSNSKVDVDWTDPSYGQINIPI